VSKLPYLVQEVNCALEVYLLGRTGHQYNRTSFLLCDDAVELASKLFLLTDTPAWSDLKPGSNRFKNFWEVTADVRAVLAKRPADYARIDQLLTTMQTRRGRRNDFFHSTHLLDLNLQSKDCVESFCDLLDYGKLLFPIDPGAVGSGWEGAMEAAGNMRTCEIMLRLDRKTYGDPSVESRVNEVLAKWPRNGPNPKKIGSEVVNHAEDMHLRLAIRNGGRLLRDKLNALL